MNNFAFESRNRRNLFAHVINSFSPPFHKNYSTDTTAEMKTPYGDSLFINPLHLIPEPMKMNLADSVVTLDETKPKTNMAVETKDFVNNLKESTKNTRSDFYPSLAGITNFFSGVLNVMGGMFQKRANSPVQYYDCFEGCEDPHQMTPSSLAWQAAKHEDLNKNGRAETDDFADETFAEFSTEMNGDFRSIAAHCEDKLNRVRLLLSGGAVQRTVRARRPKRAFHEAGSVEELFEDAFTPEDFINLANETFLEYCSPYNHHHEETHEADAPKIKTETPIKESMEIIQNLPSKDCGESKENTPGDKCEEIRATKKEIVTSCEDKVNQLKALLQRRCQQKPSKLDLSTSSLADSEKSPAIPIPNCIDAQKQAEVIFAKDIELPPSPDSPHVLDPSSYFDEVTGRFYSSSATDSEDSFQIVFSDSPRNSRKRIPSDCESEDSFIVFEETPDSCYTSNDVFCDDIDAANSDSDCDSDCGSDFDSGVSTITLSHSLSRTFGDLTDGSLYEDGKSEDVVDCAFRSGSELPMELIDDRQVARGSQDQSESKGGLLLTEAKKRERKKQPPKKVQFSPLPPKVHVMRVWAFAARQARAGHWERHALDRERFKRRIADVEVAVSWVLKPQHRSRIMFQRFMPWWNAQKRKELAEQKQREEERIKREKEEAEKLETENRLAENGETHEDSKNTLDNIEVRKTEELSDNNSVKDCKSAREEEERRMQEVSSRNIDINCTVGNKSIEINKVDLSRNVDSIQTDNSIDDKKIVNETQKMIKEGVCNKILCNGNTDVNCNVNGKIDDQKVLKEKLSDQSKANTDCDKTECNDHSKVKLNGDVNANNVIKNGMKKTDYKMICYQQKQAL